MFDRAEDFFSAISSNAHASATVATGEFGAEK